MGFSMNPGLTVAPVYRLTFLGLLLLAVGCNPVDPEEGLRGLTDRCTGDESCAPGFICDERQCVVPAGSPCKEGFAFERCGMSVGVCADARRACRDGIVEASCTAASYGPRYEVDETLCDGLDNDCDGKVDRGPCELVLGVCEGAVRLCTGGLVVRTCGAESYGPQYQALELRCDGLDNDCDGLTDMSSARRLPFYFRAQLPPPVAPVESVYEYGEPRVVRFGAGFLAITASTVTSSYPYRGAQQWTRPPDYHSKLSFVPLDAELQPVGAEAVLYEGARDIRDLELVPFDGGVFLLWNGMQHTFVDEQTSTTFESFLARIDVGQGGAAPSVGLTPRAPPTGYAGSIRAAVSRDSQQLLLAWNTGQVRGRLFSRELEPRSEEVTLDAPHPDDVYGSYVSRLDVAAHGDSGFAVAWARTPPTVEGVTPPLQLRFRQVSGTLQPLGEVAGMTGEPGHLSDLRLLGSAQADDALFAAWQTSAPYIEGQPTPPPTLRYARPFAAGSPASEALQVTYGSGRVHLARDATEQVLLGLSRPQVPPVLRRIDAAGSFVERHLLLAQGTSLQTFSLLDRGDPENWTLALSAYDSIPQVLTLCRF